MKSLLKLAAPFAVILVLFGTTGLREVCDYLAQAFHKVLPFIGNAVPAGMWSSPEFYTGLLLLCICIVGIHIGKKMVKAAFTIGSVFFLLFTLASMGIVG